MIDSIKSLTSVKSLEVKKNFIKLETSIEELSDILSYLNVHYSFKYLLDVFVEDEYINYLIQNLEDNVVINVCCFFQPDIRVPSNYHIWKNCFHKEGLCQELYSIEFDFNKKDVFLGPLTTVNDEEVLKLNSNNIYMNNDLNIYFKVGDNLIKEVKIEQGFHYKNFEAFLEKKNSQEVLLNLFRLNFKRSFGLETVWCKAIEDYNGIELSDKAIALRMLFLEVERVVNHLNYFINIADELLYPQLKSKVSTWKNLITNVIKNYTGNRAHLVINCIGGVRFDIPRGWVSQTINTLEIINNSFCDYMSTIESSSLWKERLYCGRMNSTDAISLGLSGPNLRASGINYDIRKNDPYYFYGDLDFNIPLGIEGTALDRFLVRKVEVEESLRIINQILDNIPTGDIIVSDFNYFRRNFYMSEIDKLKYQESVLNPIKIDSDYHYNLIEGANGYIGVYGLGNSDGNLNFAKILSSEYCSLEAFKNIVIGNDFDDALLVFNSLDIHMSEVEK